MNYYEVVKELNAELYEATGETELNFGYVTNGFVDMITFGDSELWNSEMDDREWFEKDNDYEPFVPFIKKEFNKWVEKLHNLKFKKLNQKK
jgi:hypothetical protein